MAVYPSMFLLAPWNAARQKALIDRLPRVTLDEGEVLFEKGDVSTDAYFILSGAVKSSTCSPDGKFCYFRMRRAGDCFGYYSAVTGGSRTATMTAAEPAVLARMSGAGFVALVSENPEIARVFMKMAMTLLRIETDRLTHIVTLPAPQRVAADILRRCSASAESDCFVPPERPEWASYLGMTRETLSRALSLFARRKLIRIERKGLTILRRAELELFVGG